MFLVLLEPTAWQGEETEEVAAAADLGATWAAQG